MVHDWLFGAIILFALFGLELPDVELELLSLEDITVGTTNLAGPGRDGGQDTARLELLLKQGVNLGGFSPVVKFLLSLLGTLFVEQSFVSLTQLRTLLSAQRQGIVGFVPLPEGGGVDGNDGVLDEGLRPDKLVVRRVVDRVDDTGLASDGLGAPGEVASVQSQRASFDVAAAHTNQVHAVRADFGHGRGTAQLVLSLLLVDGPFPTGLPLLVPFRLRYSHFYKTLVLN